MRSFLKKINEFITNSEKRTTFLASKGLYNFMSDEKFLKKQFKNVFNYDLNLEKPKTYSEKLQWLKLYDRNPLYTKMVDKYEVKRYVSDIIGEEHIIKNIGVWEKFDDIDFDQLPNQFVLKCTHDSGGIVICKNKDNFNIKKAKKIINKSLKRNYYYQNREWPYKNVKPRIIAEEYMVDESGYELKDYKFFCFNGKVKYLFVATDRSNEIEETKFDFFDDNFKLLPFTNGHPNSNRIIQKPRAFEQMKEFAERLSKDFPHVRVDLYDINGKVYFGEMTFYHWSGLKKFEPQEWDEKFGELIELPKEKRM